MERLSALDASFLRVETPTAHMHVGWLAELDLPGGRAPLEVEHLRDRIASKLHLTPRFRQRLRDAPVGDPFWSDDQGFDIAEHVRGTAPVTTERDLRAISGQFFSRQLDRSRPLWEILVVPRSGPRKAAVLGKVHHAMVDGIAAVQLGILLFDLEPYAEQTVAPPWQPQSEASPARVAVESVTDLALEQFRAARTMAGMGLRPGQAMRRAGAARRAAFSLAGEIARPAPESFLRAPLTEARVLIPARFELRRAKDIARARDAKLNDIVLTAVARALRRLSLRLGAPPLPQRAMVPISVRGEDDAGAGGNRITFGFVDLPVEREGPEECLAEVGRQMARLKRSGYADGTDMLLRTVNLLPGRLKSAVAGVAASPRTYNLTVSNVPGPTVPLFVGGARVHAVHPVIPISEGHVVSVGVLSYGGGLHFGVYADPYGLPQAAELEHLLPAAIEELEAAGEPGHSRKESPGWAASPR